jgi:hypothetical protein
MTGDTKDDDRLAGLFHAAASDTGAPPPRFDHGDVVATSRRITARRRSALVGGALAVLVVAGVGTAVTLPRGQSSALSAAAPAAPAPRDAASAPGPPPAAAPQAAVGGAGTEGGASAGTGSGGAGSNESGGGAGGGAGGGSDGNGAGVAAPGGPGSGADSSGAAGARPGGTQAGPLGAGRTACADRQDPALRALLVQALPEAANARAAATTDICLPGSQRYVSLELGGGVLTVGYLPPGTAPSLAQGASSAPTASGGTVLVAPPPALRDRAPALLAALAPRL